MPCELPPTTWTVRNQWEMPTGGNSHRIRVDQVKDPAFRRPDFSRWKFMEAQESREEQPAWTLAWQVSPENSNGWKMTSTFWWKKNWPIFGGQTCCKVTTLLSIFSQPMGSIQVLRQIGGCGLIPFSQFSSMSDVFSLAIQINGAWTGLRRFSI